MRTLDRWKHLLGDTSRIIECSEIRLGSYENQELPIFFGPGHIDIRSSTKIEFTTFALPHDDAEAIQRLMRLEQNPYDDQHRFRLIAIDYDGNEWNGGWVAPTLRRKTNQNYLLTGEVETLSIFVSGATVANTAGVELIFQPTLHIPMAKTMVSTTTIDNERVIESESAGRHDINVLGSNITFCNTPDGKALWLTATSSREIHHPYMNGWLAEPLRILLGQPIYPRLIARNRGDSTAQVTLHPSPQHFNNSQFASLYNWTREDMNENDFWSLYSGLLMMIVKATGKDSQPNFETNPVTGHYDEIIQASQGSRWVITLTLASAGEALATMLRGKKRKDTKFKSEEIKKMRKHLKTYEGDEEIKSRMLNSLAYADNLSIKGFLDILVENGIVKADQVQAWSDTRNRVMHGNLIDPWSTEEGDRQLLHLAGLVHHLTTELIRRAVDGEARIGSN